MLRKLFCKGPKYRKHISIVFHNANKNGPEISRITRITNICNEFRASSKALVNGAQNHGGQPVVSIRTLSRSFGRYYEVCLKFNDTSITFLGYILYFLGYF